MTARWAGRLKAEKSNMLPSFPKAQKILDDVWHKQMFAAKAAVFPHEIHPPVLPIAECKQADFQREDRQVKPLKMKQHQLTVRHEIKEGKGLSLKELNEKAKELGEGLGKQMWETLTGAIEEAAAETGNEIKIKKGDLRQEHILKMLETRAENFDQDGNPAGQLICGSAFGEEIKNRMAEWSEDKEFQAKMTAITNRKKEEFNEREARRRLVD
jgi:hypothetical protein